MSNYPDDIASWDWHHDSPRYEPIHSYCDECGVSSNLVDFPDSEWDLCEECTEASDLEAEDDE